MKIGDRIYVHGYVDEIRKDTVIIRNEGGYFGTVKSEIVEAQKAEDIVSVIRCKDCKFHHDRTQCSKRIGAWFDDDYCNGAVRAERKEE